MAYSGWDGVSDDSLIIVPATGPVRALTGEWCVSPGQYITASNITQAAQIKKTDNLECNRIDGVTCFRRCFRPMHCLLIDLLLY